MRDARTLPAKRLALLTVIAATATRTQRKNARTAAHAAQNAMSMNHSALST